MLKTITLFSLFLSFTSYNTVLASESSICDGLSKLKKIEDNKNECLDNPDNYSNFAMVNCIGDAFDAADAELNNNYRELLASGFGVSKETRGNLERACRSTNQEQGVIDNCVSLVEAQRGWVKFKENDAWADPEAGNGSIWHVSIINSKYSMTFSRAKELLIRASGIDGYSDAITYCNDLSEWANSIR